MEIQLSHTDAGGTLSSSLKSPRRIPHGSKGMMKFCRADGRAYAQRGHHSMAADGIGLETGRSEAESSAGRAGCPLLALKVDLPQYYQRRIDLGARLATVLYTSQTYAYSESTDVLTCVLKLKGQSLKSDVYINIGPGDHPESIICHHFLSTRG